MKLVNGSRCLYKMTGLQPIQYTNTELSPNQKIQFPSTELKASGLTAFQCVSRK